MKKILSAAMLLSVSILFYGCGGNSSSKKDDAVPAPDKAILTAPANNELCTQGTIISATQSTVTLQWNSAANADSYDVTLKNLESGTAATQTVSTTQLAVTLTRNTPYAWFVVSKSSKNSATAQSDSWKFYNSGPGVTSYAPFPADITSPLLGQAITATNNKITLSWTGNDPDNDIATYTVYFGTNNIPALYKDNVTGNSLTDVAVASGTTYYWKVITTDAKGNTSDSGLASFKVN